MDARSVKTAEDARQIVEERGLKHVKVGVFDIDGILRGKFMAKDKFFSALEKGFGFCDVVLGWDCNDQLYDNVKVTGWHTGYPDGLVEIDPSTCRELPGEDGLLFIGNYVGPHGEVGARATLKRIIEKANPWASMPTLPSSSSFLSLMRPPLRARKGLSQPQTHRPWHLWLLDDSS